MFFSAFLMKGKVLIFNIYDVLMENYSILIWNMLCYF